MDVRHFNVPRVFYTNPPKGDLSLHLRNLSHHLRRAALLVQCSRHTPTNAATTKYACPNSILTMSRQVHEGSPEDSVNKRIGLVYV